MNYEISLTLPPGMTAINPAIESVDILPGRITQVRILFPSGCAGLARCRIYRGAAQIWPSNSGAWFSGDGREIIWTEDIEITEPPWNITLEAYNEDDTYPHTLTLGIVVLSAERDIDKIIQALQSPVFAGQPVSNPALSYYEALENSNQE